MESQRYTQEQYRQKYNAGIFGLVLSIGLNLAIVLLCNFSGLKYIYPPPQEKTLVIDFEEQEPPVIKIRKYGREPSAEQADPNKNLELVQKSQAQYTGTKQNLAKASTVGTDGDVEVPEPKREEVIDNRSLFHAAQNTDKDTLAAQTAREVSDALKAGHAQGNATQAKIEGTPTARIKGRDYVGVPAKPNYGVQNEGVVVVEIWVDRQGAVIKAFPGADGTTVTDKDMWTAARQAALKTKFNVSPESPEQMKGTITYIFKLK
ncbi:MAG: energy transducer TonB [Bacteroidales bacterium]|nr:energy transducer TonB [Bacteroidales bacterium]